MIPNWVEPDWAAAEDVSMRGLVQTRPWEAGRWYYSPHVLHRRYNALRITDARVLGAIDWPPVLAEAAEVFGAHEMPVTLQLPEPLEPAGVPGSWEPVGLAFHHVVTDAADLVSASNVVLRSIDVTTDDEVEVFAHLAASARASGAEFEHVLLAARFYFGDAAGRDDVRLLLLFDDDTLVGQVAALQCPGGYSINYLTTTPDQRGRGYMKAIYGALGRELEGALFGQIADGVATLPFRQRFPSTRVLARTHTYQRTDDPYFGR